MSLLKKSLSVSITVWIAASALPLTASERNWDDGYRVYQDQAPNFIQAEILNVAVTSNKTLWFASSSDRVEVEARVLKVFRTEDNLAPGMIIPIVYDRKAAAGGTFAETPGIPERGSVVPAFIKQKGDRFIPAARHHTFSPLTEQQIARMKEEPEFLDPAQIAALQIPDAVLENALVDANSGLPLKNPEDPVSTEPVNRSASTVDIPEFTEPDAPEPPITEAVAPASTTIADVQITPAKEQPVAPVTEAETSESSSAQVLTPMPNVIPPDPETARTTVRRTVVVVPPSEIRARQAAVQEIPQILEPPRPQPVTQPPRTDQPEIETLRQPSVESPQPAPAQTESPAPRAELVEIPETQNDSATEPKVFSAAPAISIRESAAPPPRAEPVERTESVTQPEAEMETVVHSTIPETESAPSSPVIPEEPEVVMEALPAPATPEPTVSPAEEEPVTITPLTTPSPSAPEGTNEQDKPAAPVTPSSTFTESDRENMKSYAELYGMLQQAETKRASGELVEAKSLYEQVLTELESMKQNYPDFQPFMVEYRIRDTGRKLEELMMQINKLPREAGNGS